MCEKASYSPVFSNLAAIHSDATQLRAEGLVSKLPWSFAKRAATHAEEIDVVGEEGGSEEMARKYNNPKKPYIVSMRVTDEEMDKFRQIMEMTNLSAADLMRDAFTLLRQQWELSHGAEMPLQS
jgi:hypothetical protein